MGQQVINNEDISPKISPLWSDKLLDSSAGVNLALSFSFSASALVLIMIGLIVSAIGVATLVL